MRLIIVAALFALAASLTAGAQELSAERIAQQMLVDRGYDIGPVDGIWGPRSAAAMTQLQQDLGLPQTGAPDAGTLAALASSSSAAEQPEPQPAPVPQTREVVPAEPVPRPTDPEPEDSEPQELPPAITEPPPAETETKTKAPVEQPAAPKSEEARSEPIQPLAERADGGPLLLGLAIVTCIGAVGIFAFFSARERRQVRQSESFEPDLIEASKSSHVTTEAGIERVAPPKVATPPRPPRQPLGAATAADLRQHNAAVDAVVRSRAAGAPVPPRTAPPATTPHAVKRDMRTSPWVPGHETVVVGNYRLRGFIYVGETLKPQNGWGQRDNCLIVPSLPLAARADVSGQYLDYWPSYERISTSSRKAYLDWLASDRSNPQTPIGYVFLYFYGLERRLMLDRDKVEREAVIAEVERLVGVYGINSSFRRYSTELLSAAQALERRPPSPGGRPIGLGDVPTADRLELGRLVAAGQSIPPELLLSLVTNHPETRLRAPVRRLPELIAQRFCLRVEHDYPAGLRISLPRPAPMLEVNYRAASSTFEVPVIGSAQSVPDISQLTEPLGYGRAILDAVTDELDSYSREIGKATGAPTTIAGLSKLPADLRHRQAMSVAGEAMAKLNAVADSRQLYRLADLLALVGLKTDVSTKLGLRDLSQCLAGWGMGIVPDPHFAPKILADRDSVLVFRLDMTRHVETEPSEQYRLTYVCLALGVVVAKSDGVLSEAERRMLSRLILETPGISEQEQRRLVADFRWLEANPLAVSDLRQFLRESTAEFRTALMNSLVPIAAADGNMDAGEVGVLEKLAKILGLDPSVIYGALHRTAPQTDDVPMVETPRRGGGQAIPKPKPSPRNGVDHERLDKIRRETARASSLLNDIFADEEDVPAPEAAPATPSAAGELDQRHRVLLDELMTRSEWSEEDFGRLVRQAGLMPHSVIGKLNDWSIERFDELILAGDGPIVVNASIVLETA